MEPPTPTPRLRVIQRSALALLVLAGVVNYIDRGPTGRRSASLRSEGAIDQTGLGFQSAGSLKFLG